MPRPESFHSREHREPLEPLPEALERWLREQLSAQYKEQVQFLREEGILELLPNAEKMGILGIDGKEYPIPLPADIEAALTASPEIREAYATKIAQGFTELQLTPFAKPLAQLEELLRRSLLKHHKDKKLLSSDGTPLDLDTNQPLYVWDGFDDADTTTDPTKALVYYPERFDPTNHGGKTKKQLLDEGRGRAPLEAKLLTGWNILLLESDPTIPRQGQGTTTKGRKRLEANRTPNDYLKALQTNPIYTKESGMTPEDWITRFLRELQTKNRVLNDYSNLNDSLNYLLASYHPSSGYVPYGYWNRGDRQADVGRDVPGNRNGVSGVCPAVHIL